ncbi:MAG: type II toxin-antitoxin system HicA family toxin [Candidatus Solibacter usitatus]|nr:type II toxin-antitoxin system HicA family toxin [Candidatus Solibacter usitatus]
MSRPPRVSGKDVLGALLRAGYAESHVRGSHHYLRKPGASGLVTVPVHGNRTLPPKTLQSILRQAGMTADELSGHL